MDPEKNEQKRDDQDLGMLQKGMKTLSKKAKNVFSMIFKKIVAALVTPLLIKIVLGLALVGVIVAAFSTLLDLFGSGSTANVASMRVIENEVSITSTETEGYYFKINDDVIEKYTEELFKADQEGYYEIPDSDSDSDEEDEEEEAEEEEEEIEYDEYDEEERNSTRETIEDWFNTEDFDEYLIKMIRAQIASSYPKLGDYEGEDGSEDSQGNKKDKDGDYVAQGVVEIHRTFMNQDGTVGSEIELDYLPYEEFSALVQANDSSVLNNFSFDEEKGLVYYATYTETVVTVNGVETSRTYTLRENSVSYTALTTMSSMPFNFLFALLQTSELPSYVMAVIDLLLEESEIVLMIQDQLSITEITEINRQAQQTDTQTVTSYTETYRDGNGTSDERTYWVYGATTTTYSFPAGGTEEIVTTTYTNTANAYIQKAYTWCLDFEQEATLNTVINEGESVEVNYSDSEISSLSYTLVSSNRDSIPSASSASSYTIVDTYLSDSYLLASSKVDTENYTWNLSLLTEKRINYEKFLGLWKNDTGEYYLGSLYDENGIEVEYILPEEDTATDAAVTRIADPTEQNIDDLVDLLSMYENTQLHEQLLKYYWNIYFGEDVYDVDLDALLNLFNTSVMTSVTGSSLVNYIKAWENSSLWQYETGLSTSFPTGYLSSDGNYYIVYEDGSAGHNNIAYGIATFISSSSNASVTHPTYGAGYYNWQSILATYGIDVTTLYEGAEVPVDAVNSAFEDIIGTFESKVDTYLSSHGITLTQTQRDALVAVCYQYGNINGFAEAYNASLDSEGNVDPELIKQNFVLTSNNNAQPFNYSSTTNDRKYANWYLFTEGIYLDRSGNVIQAQGGSIVEWAKTIHDYMSDTSHLYYYCLNGTEKSRSTHISAGLSCGLASSFAASQVSGNNGYRLTCCATYVSWVLEEAGYLETHTDAAITLSSYLAALGWTKISSYSELEAGDIVFMDTVGVNNGDITHVQIYVGNGTWYSAGSNSSIHRVEAMPDDGASGQFIYAYRAPN